MSDEWAESLTIGDLISRDGGSIKTGPFGTSLKASEYAREGVPLISVKEIGRGTFHIDSKTPRVAKPTLLRLPEYILLEGDIVFARKGGIDRCAMIGRSESGWFLGSDGIRLRPPSTCHARFLAYSLQTQPVRDWLTQNSTGSTMASLNQATIGRLPILLPSIGDQVEIAQLLGTLDDRITLLRETNATLEAIAQALFKSWFVDFDPVRAKQQGLAPAGMDEATAALFPCTIETWKAQAARATVSDLTAQGALLVGDGYRAKNNELGEPGLPFVRAGDLDEGQITPTKDFLGAAAIKAAATKMARPGDTAFTSKGTIGRFAFVDEGAGEAVYSPQVCFWRSLRKDIIEPTYLHYWMKSPAFTAQVDVVRGQAAIMDYVSLADQRRMRIDLPPIGIQKRFAEVARALLERISCNRAIATNLVSLRDTLLPRLISGQIRLPEAEALAMA